MASRSPWQPIEAGYLVGLCPRRRQTLMPCRPANKGWPLQLPIYAPWPTRWEKSLLIGGDTISLSHRLAASVDGETGSVLGLPPLTDLTMRTDAEGVLGTATFRLRVDWLRGGQVRTPRRTGAILETDRGPQRLHSGCSMPWLWQKPTAPEPMMRRNGKHWRASEKHLNRELSYLVTERPRDSQ